MDQIGVLIQHLWDNSAVPRRVARSLTRSTTSSAPYDAAGLRDLVRRLTAAQRRLLIDAVVDVVVEGPSRESDPDQAIRRELGPVEDHGSGA